ncbi:MAG: twin-arginine translocation signal domain-containing protein [Actinobacteria bacterium]|nr:MAG: twin-arginine translocation signal domain-containing protein [Actinomycetota bacterium]
MREGGSKSMAITRRQFVTRLGTLAAAMGLSQVDAAKISEVFAHAPAGTLFWYQKPRVVWVHGAECTGCSTSLLSLFEDVQGEAIYGSGVSTLAALDLAVGGNGDGTQVVTNGLDAGHPFGHRTVVNSAPVTGSDFDTDANATRGAYIANIADVLVDFISLEYHETVNGMGGDLAYQWLLDQMTAGDDPTKAFVLVVEGATQDKTEAGAWSDTAGNGFPWCSIGMDGADGASAEHSFDDVVTTLAGRGDCIGVVAIGQCATFGGYPGCVSPKFTASQTPARGTYDHLDHAAGAKDKVINVPGCPTNPWWFTLSVVAFLVDYFNGPGAPVPADGPLGILDSAGNIKSTAVDGNRRLKAVYGVPLHGPACTRYQDFLNGVYATRPGERGCLQLIGCKGPSTNSLCTVHGWNGQQPENDTSWDYGIATVQGAKGGNCVAGGAPCMGCTEPGYPDRFVPFVVRR